MESETTSILYLISILGAVLIGAMSPGPSFIFVTRTAISSSRRNGLAAAMGIGVGGLVYGSLALFGLHALFAQVEWLYVLVKLAGGLYLLWLCVGMWRDSSAKPVTSDGTVSTGGGVRSFLLAAATQISNPKAALFYGGIFAAFLPASVPLWMYGVLLPSVFLIEAGWYSIVALTFSSDRPRNAYLRCKRAIDRIAGSVMGALGIRLIFDASRTH